MFGDSWERFAPLTGVAFVVIVFAAFAIGGSTPDAHDSAAKVSEFYSNHRDKHMALSFILAIGAAFLPFFASTLRRTLDWSGGTGRLANAAFAGGVLATVGFWLLATVHLALADSAGKTPAQVTQTLNVLDGNDYIPVGLGMAVLLLASGLSIVRHGALPRWLGWVAVVLGILSFTPAGFIGFLGSGLWVLVTSIILFLAGPFRENPDAATLPA
jgi:MFS family permease